MRIRKAVIPAAGLGTRFLPATKAQPKEMLPLVDKPLIQYVVEEAVASGIDQVIIVTGRGKGAIEDHFDVAFELEKTLEERGKGDLLQQVRASSNLATVSFVRQKQALGLGHAVLAARDLVGDEPFAVLLGDDIIDGPTPCIGQMMDVFEEYRTSVLATQEVNGPAISQYGVIETGATVGVAESGVFKVLDLVEKPPFEQAPSNLAVIGRYLLTPEIFEVLDRTAPDGGGEIQLTHGLRGLLNSQAIHALRFAGKRYDAGDKLGFLEATVEFALKRQDLGRRFAEYLRQLQV